jgi:hypothetical protein
MIKDHDGSKKSISLDLDIEKWRLIILGWESSKESQKTYCEHLGINLNTFIYVRSKLTRSKQSKVTFVPVELNQSKDQRQWHTDTVVIEHPRGLKLYVSPDLSLERLTKIFKLCGW